VTNQRREYYPPARILNEIELALCRHESRDIDWITFVGSGEPTLHSGLGRMIREVKSRTDLPVAVLTNGSLLHREDVRQELLAADAVLPSLDAGSAELYRRINRPHPELVFDLVVDGLVAFSRAYEGKLWVEVMLLDGLNDSETALRDLANLLQRVAPNEVHVSLPTRPPAEAWVHPADQEALMRATATLGDIARLVTPAVGEFCLSAYDDVVDAIVDIVTRHPMREAELLNALDRWSPDDVSTALQQLVDSGRLQLVKRYGDRFWCIAGAKYALDRHK
jgi:wyosine [tRNA(Phe)-imidazoG37] synthetase (radical SAM superfamily)